MVRLKFCFACSTGYRYMCITHRTFFPDQPDTSADLFFFVCSQEASCEQQLARKCRAGSH